MTATYEMLKKHFSTIFLFLFTARVYMCVRVSFDSWESISAPLVVMETVGAMCMCLCFIEEHPHHL